MLYLLPGMGVDSRMYRGAWRSLPETMFLDWPVCPVKTLAELASAVIDQAGIGPDDDVGGTSLGGMVAQEIAQQLGQKRVLMISSAIVRQEINAFLRSLSPLLPIAPVALAKHVLRLAGRPTSAMVADLPPEQLRQMCRAIVSWPGCADLDVQRVRIHGTRDWMIRCPAQAHRIEKAGHLVAITHAEECVRLVRRHWSQQERDCTLAQRHGD